mgnify:CR=1 FL=1
MIRKKNLWFLTLFSLIIVLSVYYVTMPSDLLYASTQKEENREEIKVTETNLIETLKTEDNVNTLDKINSYKEQISNKDATTEDKNKAFDAIKLLNQISSKEELLEEKIKNLYSLDSFIKIEDDQIKVIIDSDNHTSSIANKIMRTIQENFDTKKYISVNFK